LNVVQADSKVLIRVATAPNMDDPAVLDPLLKTESWQTLATFARESARTSSMFPPYMYIATHLLNVCFVHSTSTSYAARARSSVNA
jgi:hypothetical protein